VVGGMTTVTPSSKSTYAQLEEIAGPLRAEACARGEAMSATSMRCVAAADHRARAYERAGQTGELV
jgi:hypothetical protein